MSESRGTGALEPGVFRRGRGLVGVESWVELRRGTGGTRLACPGMLGTGLLPAFIPGVGVGVAIMGIAIFRAWLEGCSFFTAWHSHTQGILASF